MGSGEIAYTLIKTWHFWGLIFVLSMLIIGQYILFIFKRSSFQSHLMFEKIYQRRAEICANTNTYIIRLERLIFNYVNNTADPKALATIDTAIKAFIDFIDENEFYYADETVVRLKNAITLSSRAAIRYHQALKSNNKTQDPQQILKDYLLEFEGLKKDLRKQFKRRIGVKD